jgi:endonuclease/exonuclease/phosphatase family metal-dependent hydrolase
MTRPLRLVTYNVHGCVGGDGALSEARVADVLAAVEPDVVVIQELDVGRERSQRGHQPERIATHLAMSFLFCPTVQDGDAHYGHAILSRHPIRHVRTGALPAVRRPRATEPRSALWAEIEGPDLTLQVIGTHLGLSPFERYLQASALRGSAWMGSPDYAGPRVLCGDLNVGPHSSTYYRLRTGLRDVQRVAFGLRARPTYPAKFPLLRLDHVFSSRELDVRRVEVVTTKLARAASDHLPLVVDLARAEEVPS